MAQTPTTSHARIGTFINRGLKLTRVPPPTREAPKRDYDRTGVLVGAVDDVIPAPVYGDKISIDYVNDHWNFLIVATTVKGDPCHLIVSKRGWVPAVPLPTELEGDDGLGRVIKFAYTTDVPPQLAQVTRKIA